MNDLVSLTMISGTHLTHPDTAYSPAIFYVELVLTVIGLGSLAEKSLMSEMTGVMMVDYIPLGYGATLFSTILKSSYWFGMNSPFPTP